MSYETYRLLFDSFFYGGIGLSLIGSIVFAIRMRGVERGSEKWNKLVKERKYWLLGSLGCSVIGLILAIFMLIGGQ